MLGKRWPGAEKEGVVENTVARCRGRWDLSAGAGEGTITNGSQDGRRAEAARSLVHAIGCSLDCALHATISSHEMEVYRRDNEGRWAAACPCAK